MTSARAVVCIGLFVGGLLVPQAAVAQDANWGLVIRFQGGLDLPGYEFFSVSGVYFFGAR